MPGKKHTPQGGPISGEGFVNLAKERGAKVTPNAHQGFTRIETPQGSMYINPSRDTLDRNTRGNIKKWFRFLGLMSVAGIIAKVIFPFALPILNAIFG